MSTPLSTSQNTSEVIRSAVMEATDFEDDDTFQEELEVDVLIEIPYGSQLKYEYDWETKVLRCDRRLHTPFSYPFNYGYIPHTRSGDGDELDAVVLTRYPIQPGCMIRCRMLGVLLTVDEHGDDEKMILVPVNKVDPDFADTQRLTDLTSHQRDQIYFFFENYKRLEPDKWVKVSGFEGRKSALTHYKQAVHREQERLAYMATPFG